MEVIRQIERMGGMECIAYKTGYKYQIVESSITRDCLTPDQDIVTRYITLTTEGELTLKEGYAWDGPSGPTFDTLNFMRGSLIHDALYQLMREGELDGRTFRKPADKTLRKICREDGMSWVRAWGVYHAVRIAGGKAARPKSKKKVHRAPKACQ